MLLDAKGEGKITPSGFNPNQNLGLGRETPPWTADKEGELIATFRKPELQRSPDALARD